MSPFTYYFQRTRHLCVYQYDCITATTLSSRLFFPFVTKLTLIDCSRSGIFNLLYSRHFPKLEYIYYLSGHPGTYDIYRRFPKTVKWIFPNRDYSFYNCMLEAGYGEKSNDVISANIYDKRMINQVPSFDIHIPGYGRREGALYKPYMYEYFHDPQVRTALSEQELIPVDKYDEYNHIRSLTARHVNSLQQYNQQCIDNDFFNHIMRDA